jgi:hypothetical protein
MAIIPKPGENQMPAEMKPLGGLSAVPPGLMTVNTPLEIGIRRGVQMDESNRIASQILRDRGVYERQPVGPVEYSEGNIKKSAEITGVAGYNHKQIPFRNSPDDMSQMEYMRSVATNNPQNRAALQQLTLQTNQYFLNTQELNDNKVVTSHNTPTNLMVLAKVKAMKQMGK